MSDERAKRVAKNEAVFREINERIGELTDAQREEWLEALCECADASCVATISITLPEYEAVRTRGDRFALVAGHELPEFEHVVERNERFFVVEKIGTGADVARDLDPRA